MVGLKISSEEIKEIIPILGLTDEDQGKVYLILLSLGMATLGQISLLSGLDFFKTEECLEFLVGSRLAKKISGKIGRYVALEPFLRSFFLAYDPVTMINIRKESSFAFQMKEKQIDDIFTDTAEIVQKQADGLKDDFSDGLSPIKTKFSKLTSSLSQVISSVENNTHMNIEKLKTNIQLMTKQTESLNEEISEINIEQLKNIPSIFDPYSSSVKQENTNISQSVNNDLQQIKNNNKTNFELLENSFNKEITDQSVKIGEVLKKFEKDLSDELKNFEDKVERIGSLIENLRSNASQKKSKFLEIRQGYKEIDEGVKNLFTEIDYRLNSIESLISHSIEDIQSRKLFKGKDVFISNLNGVDRDRKAIQQILQENSLVLEKLKGINSSLKETEDDIVQATEIGLEEVRKVLDEEVQLLSNDLNDIRIKISSEFGNSLLAFLDTKKGDIETNIESIITAFDQKISILNQQLDDVTDDFCDKISNLVQKTAEEFESNLKSYLEKEQHFDVEKSRINDVLNTMDKLSEQSRTELKRGHNQISDLEDTFNIYISGLNTFAASFADRQLEVINSSLNKTKERLSAQIIKIEKQIEQEVSAITFSIKDMKQKLDRISELSRSVEFSEIEPSLLSSDLVVGETAIIMILRDLTLRAKASLTILMPRPELQTLIAASNLPMKTRINIIGDFRKVPESTLKKILSTANLRLKQLDKIDFWGCIRDSEELLVCPEPKNPEEEELIGVITTNDNLVELFSKELITYTTRSREIVL